MKTQIQTSLSKVDINHPLYVKTKNHKRAHLLKIKYNKKTIDNLMTDLMDTYEEVKRRK